MELHCERNVLEDPLQNLGVGEIGRREDPVLGSNNLRHMLRLLDKSRYNLRCGAYIDVRKMREDPGKAVLVQLTSISNNHDPLAL